MLHLTITGPRIFALLFALYPVIDVLASRICQKHRCIIGFACFLGIEALDLCLTVFEQSGGDLWGERLFPLLKEAVILPHHELTATVPAVKILFTLVDVFTTPGTLADNNPFRLEQVLFVCTDAGIGLDQLAHLRFNFGHELVRVCLALGNLGQAIFPFSSQSGRGQAFRQRSFCGGNNQL